MAQPPPTKVWNWQTNDAAKTYLDKNLSEVKKEQLWEKSTAPKVVIHRTGLILPVVSSPTAKLIDRYPIIRPDGTFHSARFLDTNREAAELYGVSGAAINAYSQRSFMERNSLERKLDGERNSWEYRRWYYLHNPTPWKRSIVK